MSQNTDDSMTRSAVEASTTRDTPRNSFEKALRVAALPWNYDHGDFVRLFKRGYDCYPDTDEGGDQLLRDFDEFARRAVQYDPDTDDTPDITDPGMLAVNATLAIECIRDHDVLAGTPVEKIALVDDVRTLYLDTLVDMIRTEAPDAGIPQDVAEHVFARDFAADPYLGRICTDIRRMPELGGGRYIEIPMVAASKTCLIDADDDADRAFETHLHDNHLYVPASVLKDRHYDALEDAFHRVIAAQHRTVTDDQREWLTQNESKISEQIERFLATNHPERLWTDGTRTDRHLDAITNAVEAAPDDLAQLGEYHTARTLMDAIDAYSPDDEWETIVLDGIDSARSVGNLLGECEGTPKLDIDREGRTNGYRLQRYVGDSKQLHVEDPEDLFELPCFANVRDRLHEKKPVRKDLFSLARLVMWLPKHQPDPDIDAVLDDLHGLFSEWPWYDPAETEYQVRYEFEHGTTSDGDPYLPVGCDSDVMGRYCIGKRDCEYSIYGSIPFPDEMYDHLDAD